MTARKKASPKRKKRIIILLLTAVLFVLFLELRLKPIAASVAENQAKAMASEIVNRSVYEVLEETGITAEMLESISFSQGSKITSISSDAVLTNRLKTAVTLKIQDRLSQIKSRRVDIPLGTLVGSELMNGPGPSIPIYISLSGNVSSDFVSSFESGGLNQTVHSLSIAVTTELHIILPLGSTDTSVSTSVLVGETVIVGDVPQGMIYSHGAVG